MNKKKVFMIFLLIAFICAIVTVFIIINNNSVAKISEQTNTTDTKATADMITITDNFFIQQTDDVYYNMDEYIGKTIKIEGLIYPYLDSNRNTYYAVVRNSPGCCGNDGLAGIDIRYDGEYPEKNTWVEVIGTIEIDTVDGGRLPAIKVLTINEKEPGLTFVTN